jgi:hypothetical protein
MYAHSNNLKPRRLMWASLIAVLAPTLAHAEGSIFFDGADMPATEADSKLENLSADVLAGSNTMTITAWVKAAGFGEGGFGTILRLDEEGQIVLQHEASTNTYGFVALWNDPGQIVAAWTFGGTDPQWTCLQVTYDKSDPNNDPSVYVNGAAVTVNPGLTQPSGTPEPVGVGYCVGNDTSQVVTWDGQIAQVQVHNRILSRSELNACRHDPGSVRNGLRLWLPMLNASDVNDRSGNEFHATATDVTTGADYPPADYLFRFAVTTETRGEIVVPNSGLRGVLGLGPEATKLIADTGVTGEFIRTADFATTPVDSATVSGLSIDGNKINTGTFVFAGHPNMGEWAQAEVADGVAILANHSRITNCRIRGFRGSAAAVYRPADSPQWGLLQQIDNCDIAQNLIGVHVTSSDQRVFQNMIANSRDAGIRINNDCGNVQTANNHVFGAYRAYENLGGDGGNHVNDYYADAYRGIHLDYGAEHTHFTNCLVQHCWQQAVFIGGARNSFTNCRFECAMSSADWGNAIGVQLDHIADYTRFTGCQFGVNYWVNPADTGHAAALAAIYINLDEGGPNPQSLEGVNISGLAYTDFERTDDVLMRIVSTSDAVRSLTVDMDVEGFNDANDKLLVVDSDTSFRNCKLVFRGNFGGNLGAGGRTLDDLFDLPTAWNGAMDDEEGNSITVYDTNDGDVHELNMNATY